MQCCGRRSHSWEREHDASGRTRQRWRHAGASRSSCCSQVCRRHDRRRLSGWREVGRTSSCSRMWVLIMRVSRSIASAERKRTGSSRIVVYGSIGCRSTASSCPWDPLSVTHVSARDPSGSGRFLLSVRNPHPLMWWGSGENLRPPRRPHPLIHSKDQPEAEQRAEGERSETE